MLKTMSWLLRNFYNDALVLANLCNSNYLEKQTITDQGPFSVSCSK